MLPQLMSAGDTAAPRAGQLMSAGAAVTTVGQLMSAGTTAGQLMSAGEAAGQLMSAGMAVTTEESMAGVIPWTWDTAAGAASAALAVAATAPMANGTANTVARTERTNLFVIVGFVLT
jgi:hypothetical protein